MYHVASVCVIIIKNIFSGLFSESGLNEVELPGMPYKIYPEIRKEEKRERKI